MDKRKNIPILRFPDFTMELESKKLGDEIKESGYGPRFNGDDYSTTGNVKTIRGTDISLEGEILYDQVPLASLDVNFIKNHILEEGDLVMITTADCGLTGVFRKQSIDYIPSAYAVKLKLKKTSNPNYFKYFFQTKFAKNQVNKFIRKATVANLPGSDILKFSIQIPSLPEQTKIASFLTAVDERLSQLKQKKTLLEQYKKGVMQKIFDQEIRFKDDDGNEFPEWEEKALVELLNEHKVRNTKKKFIEVFSVAKNKGVINQIEHLGRSYASSDTSNYKVAFPYDIIYTKSPTSDFPFGIIKQNKLERTGIVSVLYAVFTPKNKYIGLLLDYYFSNWMNTYNYLNPLVQKGAKNTMNIGNDAFLNGAEIPLPASEVEQAKIANFLSAIDEKIYCCTDQISKTVQYKKGLLQQMFC